MASYERMQVMFKDNFCCLELYVYILVWGVKCFPYLMTIKWHYSFNFQWCKFDDDVVSLVSSGYGYGYGITKIQTVKKRFIEGTVFRDTYLNSWAVFFKHLYVVLELAFNFFLIQSHNLLLQATKKEAIDNNFGGYEVGRFTLNFLF